MDRLPLLANTRQFAGHQIGARHRDYCPDYRVPVRDHIPTAQAFGLDYVSTRSDPAREAADCGAVVAYFDEQPVTTLP